MFNKFSTISQYVAFVTGLLMIICCFLPWCYYPAINDTFTGFYVKPFATGNYYGRAGYPITVLTILIMICSFIPKIWAKRLNLFAGALLLAYVARTWIIFTAGLVEGDVVKKTGIYGVIFCAVLLMVTSLFPTQKLPLKK